MFMSFLCIVFPFKMDDYVRLVHDYPLAYVTEFAKKSYTCIRFRDFE